MPENIREQEVTLSDYIRVLYRGRGIVLVSFLVVFLATCYYTFTALPVYEASALVMIKEEGRVQKQIFEVSSFIKQETMINNQVEILKSRTLGEDVIARLQTSTHADSLGIIGGRMGKAALSVRNPVTALFRRSDLKAKNSSLDNLVKRFRKSITVTPKRGTDMIELKAQAYSPFEASFVTNTWMEAYREMDISESRGEINEVVKFLEEKLQTVKSELGSSEEELKKYKESRKVAELSGETQQLIKQLADFETLYQAAATDLEANQKRLIHLRTQLGESKQAIMTSGVSSPVIAELEKQMAVMIGEKASYEQQLKGAGLDSENDEKLKNMDQRLQGIQRKIVEQKQEMMANEAAFDPMGSSAVIITQILQIETENTALLAKTNALRVIVAQYNRELDALPEKSLTLARLQREATVNQNIFMLLREKYEENRIVEAGQIGTVRIVDRAREPLIPIKPKKKLNLILGFMVGLGLGVGLTFLREYLDTSLKSMEDVERLGFSVLGSIPLIAPQQVVRASSKTKVEINQIESRLVTHFAPKSPISEAYRTLRTNIQYYKIDRPIKTVLISSAGPGEGKSTSVANAAITFAQMGTRTLLVDTDLRRPVLHGIFGMSRAEGLTTVLMGKTPLEKAIQPTKVENLHLLTCGPLPPNPSEMLASEAMEKTLKKMASLYDMVLFDSPPVIAVTDAAVLANKLDGVVLIIKSGSTGKEALLRSRILLENVNARVFGVIVNGVNVDRMYGSYYYYYHYYYYGDGKHMKRGSGFRGWGLRKKKVEA